MNNISTSDNLNNEVETSTPNFNLPKDCYSSQTLNNTVISTDMEDSLCTEYSLPSSEDTITSQYVYLNYKFIFNDKLLFIIYKTVNKVYFTSVCGGRRIVDMKHIFSQIQNEKHHISGLGCSFLNSELINEIQKGFETKWIFKCKMCNLLTTVESENKDPNYVPINKSVVNGTYAIGIGYTQLAEFSASLDVPCMAPTTYIKYSNEMSIHMETTAWSVMKLAGMEEKKLALEAGDIDSDGTPMCPVVADGQWSKRSYKTKYDAFSGAVIFLL